MDNKVLEQMIKEAMASMINENNVKTEESTVNKSTSTNVNTGENLKVEDYPLIQKRPELVETPTNMKIDDITLDRVMDGSIDSDDLKIRRETLFMQAEIADDAGRTAFADNLRRAAELISISDDRILEIYNALRPNRSSKEELLAIADELESFECHVNAELVREAAVVYEQRRLLRKED